MPTLRRFPSALRRSDGDSDPPPRREGPSKADLAMMTPSELKDYYQKRGEWQSADLEAIAAARRQNDYGPLTRIFDREAITRCPNKK